MTAQGSAAGSADGQQEREAATNHIMRVRYEDATPEELVEAGIGPHARELLDIDLICEGVTDECRLWEPCDDQAHHDYRTSDWHGCGVDRDAPCECETLIEAVEEGYDEFHGVEHKVIDGDVMAPTHLCFVLEMPSAQESAWDIAEGLPPGDYPVHVTYEDDEFVLLELAP